MKKFLSLLLVAIMALSCFSFAFAAEEEKDPARIAVNTAAIQAYLDSKDYKYEYDEDNDRITMDFNIDNSFKECHVRVLISDDGFTVRASFAKVPSAKAAKVALLAIWLNYELRVGKFSMDQEDGELLYEYTLCTEEAVGTQTAIGSAIIIPIVMADNYGEGFYEIIENGMEPADAYELCME